MGLFDYVNLPPGLSQHNIEKDLITKGFYQIPNLQGSAVIDSAIAQVFGANQIDMKMKEIGYVLNRYHSMDFDYFFNPRSLTYDFQVLFDNIRYHGAIPDAVVRNESVESIIKTITDIVLNETNHIDPEWICESENEQAFCDAAYDYELIV